MTTKYWAAFSFLVGVMGASAPMAGEPLIGLQRAAQKAQTQAEIRRVEREELQKDSLQALGRLIQAPASARPKAKAALEAAEKREAHAVIGELQSTAALRRSRQALAEAINNFVEQGEVIERAAARAARGEYVPSATDLVACDGPDCTRLSAGEHAALVLMGAVGAEFDAGQWPPGGDDAPITVLAHALEAPPLAKLRRVVEESQGLTDVAGRALEAARSAMSETGARPEAAQGYARARAAAEAAAARRMKAVSDLERALRHYGDAGRALKRAALLAGDSFVLKSHRRAACKLSACIAVEGLEAAAFLVAGAAENLQGDLKNLETFATRDGTGRLVFR